jgi:hypothetical protein
MSLIAAGLPPDTAAWTCSRIVSLLGVSLEREFRGTAIRYRRTAR